MEGSPEQGLGVLVACIHDIYNLHNFLLPGLDFSGSSNFFHWAFCSLLSVGFYLLGMNETQALMKLQVASCIGFLFNV